MINRAINFVTLLPATHGTGLTFGLLNLLHCIKPTFIGNACIPLAPYEMKVAFGNSVALATLIIPVLTAFVELYNLAYENEQLRARINDLEQRLSDEQRIRNKLDGGIVLYDANQ